MALLCQREIQLLTDRYSFEPDWTIRNRIVCDSTHINGSHVLRPQRNGIHSVFNKTSFFQVLTILLTIARFYTVLKEVGRATISSTILMFPWIDKS